MTRRRTGGAMRLRGCATAGMLLCLSAVPARAQTTRPLTSDPEKAPLHVDYSVVYTGRLFGFFSWPSEQTDVQTKCGDAAGGASGPGEALVDAIAKLAGQEPHLRVAVAD